MPPVAAALSEHSIDQYLPVCTAHPFSRFYRPLPSPLGTLYESLSSTISHSLPLLPSLPFLRFLFVPHHPIPFSCATMAAPWRLIVEYCNESTPTPTLSVHTAHAIVSSSHVLVPSEHYFTQSHNTTNRAQSLKTTTIVSSQRTYYRVLNGTFLPPLPIAITSCPN